MYAAGVYLVCLSMCVRSVHLSDCAHRILWHVRKCVDACMWACVCNVCRQVHFPDCKHRGLASWSGDEKQEWLLPALSAVVTVILHL